MNSNKKLTPRDGDSTVISHILTSGRTPVVEVIDETKINVTLLEKANEKDTLGANNLYIFTLSIVTCVLTTKRLSPLEIFI